VVSEGDTSAKVVKWLCSLPKTYAYRKHTGAYGVRGQPDIHGCSDGRSFVIEMKKGKNTTTALQDVRLEQWANAGALAFVAYSLADVQERFKQEGLVEDA
jgi:hypothetical protein